MLRATVVGTGFICPAHVKALRRIDAHVVGLVGSTPEKARQKPRGSVQTFASKTRTPSGGLDQPIHTEDYASILLHFENGACGAMTVSQVSAGHTSRLYFEINGSTSSLAWNSEHPNELWTGHRDGAKELLVKDATFLAPPAKALASCPGGHDEGYPDTFKQLFQRVYAYIESGAISAKTDFPMFADGHYCMLLCEAIEASARRGRWTRVEIEVGTSFCSSCACDSDVGKELRVARTGQE